MTDKAKEILSKLSGGDVKGVASVVAPELRQKAKDYAMQYFSSVILLKEMGLTEKEAFTVVDEISGVEWQKCRTCYDEALYEMANTGR